jgi:3-phosphoshikimate 1-carboxyvinyltransferase
MSLSPEEPLFAGLTQVASARALCGELRVPGDKSISHRALIFSALSPGEQRLIGLSSGADVLATAQVLRSLGVPVGGGGDIVTVGEPVGGVLSAPEGPLDCGNSGTSMRLLAGLLAGQRFPSTLDGDQSLRRRPMARIIEPLRAMGAEVAGGGPGGRAPLHLVGGVLEGIEHHSKVASAQVKSCLLLAGLQAAGTTTIREPQLSRDHSERMLEACGVSLRRFDGGVSVEGGQRLSAPAEIAVPGDISAAAFFLVAAAGLPGSELLIRGVGVNETRTGILDVLSAAGVVIERRDQRLQAGEPVADLWLRGGEVSAFHVGGDLVPRLIDELPVLAVLAARAHGESTISGAAELRAKESDRIESTAQLLRTLGVAVETRPDGMVIQGIGGAPFRGGSISSVGDHRIAMSAAVAGLASERAVEVIGSDAVGTSFPGFFQQLERCSER